MAEGEPNEVMTLSEVADYLQLAERTVLRMAQRGEIPAAKVASQWRFLRPVIRDWLAGRMQMMAPDKLLGASWNATRLLPLTEVIRPELMNLEIVPGPKEVILRQLLQPVQRSGFARDVPRLLAGLLERERMMTTAVGHGIAIPHPRRPIPGMFPEPAVAVGICREGTDFDAVDDQLVHLFFVICATREEVHLQLMAQVAWLARQERIRERLREARSLVEARECVLKAAERHGR